jgi:hypothetical protein
MEGIKNGGSKLKTARKALAYISEDNKEPEWALELMAFYYRWFD